MKNTTYEIYYDEESDFLEIFFGEPTKCYAEETEDEMIVRKDEKTHEIKSIGIVGFKKRAQILRDISQRFNLRIPMKISF